MIQNKEYEKRLANHIKNMIDIFMFSCYLNLKTLFPSKDITLITLVNNLLKKQSNNGVFAQKKNDS